MAPELARDRELRRDRGSDLGELLTRDRPACVERAPDQRERALLPALDQPATVAVGHQQPRRVRADVDAGAAQDARNATGPPRACVGRCAVGCELVIRRGLAIAARATGISRPASAATTRKPVAIQ